MRQKICFQSYSTMVRRFGFLPALLFFVEIRGKTQKHRQRSNEAAASARRHNLYGHSDYKKLQLFKGFIPFWTGYLFA